jgi:methyl-accepting chemotaxis protein
MTASTEEKSAFNVTKSDSASLASKASPAASSLRIQHYIRETPIGDIETSCRDVLELFKANPDSECIVIVDRERTPIGLTMRSRFYAKLGQRFSADLFYGKPAMKLANADPLIIDVSMSPQALIDLALTREGEKLYDCVIVTSGGRISGIMTMADMLKLSSDLRQESVQAQLRTIHTVEARVNEIAQAASEALASSLDGEQKSLEMVDLTLNGKNELDKVRGAFNDFSSNSERQERRMLELQKEAGSIGGVSKLIKELAEQSNLLAINASIEAARAGEHGKGFAVVAAEVMNLANQTKQSANRITSITGSLLNAINDAAELVHQGRAATVKNEAFVKEAEGVFHSLFLAAANNRDNAKQIGAKSRQAHEQSLEVAQEIGKLHQSFM